MPCDMTVRQISSARRSWRPSGCPPSGWTANAWSCATGPAWPTRWDEVTRWHGADLARVLARCSFLLDSVAVHDRAAPLPAGAELDVLPPSPAADGDSPRPRLRPVRASRGRDPSERSGDGDQRGYGPKSVTCNSPGAQRSRYGNQSIQTS